MLPRSGFIRQCGVLFAVATLVFLGCTGPQQVAGSISETTNGRVTGAITDHAGNPARKTQVLLLPAGYDPVRDTSVIAVDTTDTLGQYLFTDVTSGEYAVFAEHFDNGTNVSIPGVVVEDSSETVASDTLRSPGTVRVMVSDGEPSENGYLYIPGTLLYGFVESKTDPVTLDGVPSELSLQVAYSAVDRTDATVLRYDVRIGATDTVTIWNTAWQHSRSLLLNTTASGADVAGTVTDFPVLIRLHADHFNFGQAQGNGADIRFTRTDSTFLPYEIVNWDAENGRAELWVKVDTVFGNDSTQSLTLYWGNARAAEVSNGAVVFDSASGFAGVWHLDETSGSRAADASFNGNHGTYEGGLPNGSAGPVVNGQTILFPDSDYVDMGDVLDPGQNDFSVSIWIRRNSTVIPQALVAKTDGELPSNGYGFLLSIDPAQLPHLNVATGGAAWGDDSTFEVAGNRAITDSTSWHQIFAVIDRSGNAGCAIYIDGIDCTGQVSGDITGLPAVVNTRSLRIGTESDNNESYGGSLDEPTIAFTVRSADWVKLCYMNQKPDDALVKW